MTPLKARVGLTSGRGVAESVRTQWINSKHRCAGDHNALTTFTGVKHKTSFQHMRRGQCRKKRDNDDLNILQQWFQ